MLASGAGFGSIEVFADGSGLAHAARLAGPIAAPIIAAAGYMGAPIGGVVLVIGARDPRGARRALIGLGLVLALTAVASIGNRFGQVAIGATGAAIVVVAAIPRPRLHVGVAHLLAAQVHTAQLASVPNVVTAIWWASESRTTWPSTTRLGRNSTRMSTSAPTQAWAAIWLAWSLALLFVVLRRLRSATAQPRSAPAPRPAD